MTDPQTEIHAQQQAEQQAERSMDGLAAELMERLATKLGATTSVSAAFGAPIERQGVTIIPVARVALGFGAGIGRGRKPTETGEGGGGGGGASTIPLGYIEIRDGTAAFKPIRDPVRDVGFPLALVLAVSAPRVIRALLRRSRRKA
jgi:uncharacterized spore protein YtfJ